MLLIGRAFLRSPVVPVWDPAGLVFTAVAIYSLRANVVGYCFVFSV